MSVVLFTGSREWKEWRLIRDVLLDLYFVLGPFEALHGGARGADNFVHSLASQIGCTSTPVKPRYDLYGRYEAPKRRNIEMLERRPDYVVGFWDGESGGTWHCLNFAVNVYRIPTLVLTTS